MLADTGESVSSFDRRAADCPVISDVASSQVTVLYGLNYACWITWKTTGNHRFQVSNKKAGKSYNTTDARLEVVSSQFGGRCGRRGWRWVP